MFTVNEKITFQNLNLALLKIIVNKQGCRKGLRVLNGANELDENSIRNRSKNDIIEHLKIIDWSKNILGQSEEMWLYQ